MRTLTTSKGSILTANSGIIVQQVNCQGVMGSGVAAAIRLKYPQVFDQYIEFCLENSNANDLLGKLLMVKISPSLYVANIFGQLNYGRNPGSQPRQMYTSYDALDAGFQKLELFICNLHSDALDNDMDFVNPVIHYPEIGCGLGGGSWAVVSNIIKSRVGDFDQVFWHL